MAQVVKLCSKERYPGIDLNEKDDMGMKGNDHVEVNRSTFRPDFPFELAFSLLITESPSASCRPNLAPPSPPPPAAPSESSNPPRPPHHPKWSWNPSSSSRPTK